MSQQQLMGLGGVSFKSTNDLSGTTTDVTNGNTVGSPKKSGLYMAVIADTANADSIVIAGANALVLGFLQNRPAAGEIAQVYGVRGGTTKALAGASTSKGDKLITDSSGRVVTATTGAQLICGVCMEAATAAGDIIEIMLVDSYIA